MAHSAFGRRAVSRRTFVGIAFALGVFSTLAPAGARAETDARTPDQGLITRAHVAAGWLLGIQLDPNEFSRALIAEWKMSSAQENAKLSGQLDVLEKIMKVDPLRREAVRQKLAAEQLADMAKRPDLPTNHLLLATYRSQHPTIAPGPPDLTREMCDAQIELLGFVLMESLERGHPGVPQATKDQAAQRLVDRWSQLSPAERQRVARAPFQLASLRAQWELAKEVDRAKVRGRWRKDPAVAKLVAASRDRAERSADPPKPPRTTAKSLHAAQEQAAKDAEIALIQSNMIRMNHEVNMAIISNIGGGGWSYR